MPTKPTTRLRIERDDLALFERLKWRTSGATLYQATPGNGSSLPADRIFDHPAGIKVIRKPDGSYASHRELLAARAAH